MTHGAEGRPDGGAWFAVRTRARAEQAVADRLAAREFDTFLPRYLERARWSDRVVLTRRPLFTGYLFVRTNDPESAARTAGIAQILGEAVPDAQIETLRIACAAEPEFSPCPYRSGEKVIVESGPFAGCEAIVDRTDKRKLILRIEMLRRAVAVEIGRDTRVRRA